jgi:hypothetical protein
LFAGTAGASLGAWPARGASPKSSKTAPDPTLARAQRLLFAPSRPPVAYAVVGTTTVLVPLHWSWWKRARLSRGNEASPVPQWSRVPALPRDRSTQTLMLFLETRQVPSSAFVTTGPAGTVNALSHFRTALLAAPAPEAVGAKAGFATGPLPVVLITRCLHAGLRGLCLALPETRLQRYVLISAIWQTRLAHHGSGVPSTAVWALRSR